MRGGKGGDGGTGEIVVPPRPSAPNRADLLPECRRRDPSAVTREGGGAVFLRCMLT